MLTVRKPKNRLKAALIFAAFLALNGCGSDPLGPSGHTEVDRGPDTFTFLARDIENGTETLTYPWENSGTQATINITDGIFSGSAILIIEDAAGTVVHQEDIANDNDTDTAVGIAGSWTIEVRIQDLTGGFTVQIVKTI